MNPTIDRQKGPPKYEIGKITYSFPETAVLDNSIPLYFYDQEDSEIVKIELVFEAGNYYSSKGLQAGLTNQLITSGTDKWTQKQIAEKVDYYGAYLENSSTRDDANITVFSLRKYAVPVLEIVAEVLQNCSFPEAEIKTALEIKRQRFLVNSQKVSHLSKRRFNNLLFGEEHPYGRNVALTDFDVLQQSDLFEFFRKYYFIKPEIMAAGRIDTKLISDINRIFGKLKITQNGETGNSIELSQQKGRHNVDKKDAVQSALRIGRLAFNRTHTDYPEMQVLITALGGYFGSRLMSNLREDKGLTYGVGAGLASLKNAGYFFISTEVNSNSSEQAEEEIFYEIDRLRNELIPAAELNAVKNYMLGQLLRSTDGVFARLQRFGQLHMFGQDETHFVDLIERVRTASPDRLRELAREWFDRSEMTTVIAGS